MTKHNTTILVFAGGHIQNNQFTRTLANVCTPIIAADSGASHALKADISPNIVIGDMDSIPADIRSRVDADPTVTVIVDPDPRRTDLELALDQACALQPDVIAVLGAFGGRVDHELATILMLRRLPAHPRVELIDHQQRLWHGSGRQTVRGRPDDIVSVVPLSDCPDLRYTGLKWQANEPPYGLGWQGVSNRLLGEDAVVDFGGGDGLIIHARDGGWGDTLPY